MWPFHRNVTPDAGNAPTREVPLLGRRYRAVLERFFTEKALIDLLQRYLQEADYKRANQFKAKGDFDTTPYMDEAMGHFVENLTKRLQILKFIDRRVHGHPLFRGFDRKIGDNTEMIVSTLEAYLKSVPSQEMQLRPLTFQKWMSGIVSNFQFSAKKAARFTQKALECLSEWQQQPVDETAATQLANELDAFMQELNTPGSELEVR